MRSFRKSKGCPRSTILCICLSAVLGLCCDTFATIPYAAPGPFSPPVPGPALAVPSTVPGKEYNHDFDHSTMGLGGVFDAKQIVAWDGVGGTADGLDYSMPFPPFDTADQLEVDAIAHSRDVLYQPLREDLAHLIFSIDDLGTTTLPFGLAPIPVPVAGPVITTNTFLPGINFVGGAGELSYELAGSFAPVNSQGIWAPQPLINGMPLPADVDGVELWGLEPGMVPLGGDASGFGDADKYSIDTDILTGAAGAAPFSVWNYPAQTGYVPHSTIVDLVTILLGPDGGSAIDPEQINLDALMVNDVEGEPDSFDPADEIIFSIRQIVAPMAPDGSGFYSTGSELFVLSGMSLPGAPVGGFLAHGGHLWDKGYALGNMTTMLVDPTGMDVEVQLDLNALEAVGVPEPSTFCWSLLILFSLAIRQR